MAVKEKSNEYEEMEWSAEEEIQLFLALCGLRPIGINKHIHMACVCKRLSNALKRDIQPDIVWAHLNTMYNLDALNQMESLPLPQELSEFSMPESEYSTLITKKLQEEERKLEEKNEIGQKSKSSTPQPQQGITTSSTKSTPIAIQKTNQQNNMKPNASTSSVTSKLTASTTTGGGGSGSNHGGANGGGGNTSSSKILSSATSATISKPLPTSKVISNLKSNDIDRKSSNSLSGDSNNTPKRAPKRTRGSMSIESNSPSTTPPPTHTKRRRI